MDRVTDQHEQFGVDLFMDHVDLKKWEELPTCMHDDDIEFVREFWKFYPE